MSSQAEAGSLYVIEGPDGVGKTTLAAAISEALTEAGVVNKCLAFPGKEPGSLGELVYRLHHVPEQLGVQRMTNAAIQIAHVAAHVDSIEEMILPRLAKGVSIVLDRYWWSTWVYGVVAGIPRKKMERIIASESVFWGEVKPAAVVLIERSQPWRPTEAGAEWQRLTKEYAQLAAMEEQVHTVVRTSNDESPAGVAHALVGELLLETGRRRSR